MDAILGTKPAIQPSVVDSLQDSCDIQEDHSESLEPESYVITEESGTVLAAISDESSLPKLQTPPPPPSPAVVKE